MIEVDAVSKFYDGKCVLQDLHLVFKPGRTHVLLGESGSGKSTLLRMIMGLIYPDRGLIRIDGEAMSPLTRRPLAKKIGYVIQDGGLFPHLTIRDNISLVARALRWKPTDVEARLSELAEVVRLDSHIFDRYPLQLSGGQRQRAGLMRALFLNPEILLLDEPLGALDPIVRSQLQSELRDIFSKLHKLVLLVTHDLSEAAFFGDTVTLLCEGKVLQNGSFRDLDLHPAHPYVTEFFQAQRILHRTESSK